MSTAPKFPGGSLHCDGRDGKIVLEIDEVRFLRDAVRDSGNALGIVVRKRFLNFAVQNIFSLTHDVSELDRRESWWLRLTQALGKAAASTGHGVKRFAVPEPTCGCNPEEFDGG